MLFTWRQLFKALQKTVAVWTHKPVPSLWPGTLRALRDHPCSRIAGGRDHKEVKQMRDYEALYILRPDLGEEAIKATVEKFSALVAEQGGSVSKIDEWGTRKLAYEVEDYLDGYYVLMDFASENTCPSELERVFKITDEVLRYMVTRKGE